MSLQIETFHRSQRAVDFKEQVRLEVEERMRKEAAEREAKRQAAEDRRAAVVDRLRKKAEDEERRRLEAEAALLRIQEEGLRREQEARDRLESDRRHMQLEDDFSHLSEQDHKERMEKQLYLQREKEKLAEWERAQRLKDEEEARQRQARMAVLEEKKARLAELKRLQELSNSKDGSTAVNASLNVARDEAAKLNKQMRIQNKAKFVTKKIQSGSNADAVSAVVDVNTVDLSSNTMDSAVQVGASSRADEGSAAAITGGMTSVTSSIAKGWVAAAAASVAGADMTQEQAQVQNPEREKFTLQLVAMESEVAVKALQRDLMAEKRGLRLIQKQRMADQRGAQGPAEIEYAKELRGKIDEITYRENAAQRRLDQILALQKAGSTGMSTGTSGKTSTVAATTEVTPMAASIAHHEVDTPSTAQSVNQATLLHKAEHALREGTHILQWLAEKAGTGPAASGAASDHNTGRAPALGLMNKSFAKSFVFIRTDDASMQRRATVLLMEMSQLLKDIDPRCDPSNYSEQLSAMSSNLKAGLSKAVAAPSEPPNSGRTLESPAVSTATNPNSPQPQPHIPVDNRSMHPSASTTSIPQGHAANMKEQSTLLSSVSTSELQTKPTSGIAADKLSRVESPRTTSVVTKVAEASAITDCVAGDCVDCEPEGGEGEGEDEEAVAFEDIPGWEECLTTSMASAAHHAAFYGYTEVLDCLCKYFDCFVMDKKGRTPLFYAALQNKLSCVASLVALDSQWIDVGDQNGDTSLHAAAIANGVEVLSFLLSCEANPDTANYAGLTPCHLARSKDALVVLCNAGAQAYCVDSKSRMPLWFACNEGRGDCAEFLCSMTPSQYILWPDDEGETCLHRAAMSGHSACVEALCQSLQGVEDLYTVNKKQHTAAHVASNPAVLKALYENGANLWIADPKGRMPLFTASFFGKADCIAFLLDIASNSSSNVGSKKGGTKDKSDGPTVVSTPDKQGDTALHAACLCGHIQCVSLLLYYTRSARNKQGLTPDELALRAGHQQIAHLVQHIEHKKAAEGLSALEIFRCDFSLLSAVTLYYGSRWCKQYDLSFDTVYYLDRATGASQWERPDAYDEPVKEERRGDAARAVLHAFYSKYNPEKLCSMNDILFAYKGRYTELFISLANKYNVEDLSMFEGVDLD